MSSVGFGFEISVTSEAIPIVLIFNAGSSTYPVSLMLRSAIGSQHFQTMPYVSSPATILNPNVTYINEHPPRTYIDNRGSVIPYENGPSTSDNLSQLTKI